MIVIGAELVRSPSAWVVVANKHSNTGPLKL